MKLTALTMSVLLAGSAALAESHAENPFAASGDAAAGEEAFKKQCITCHVVVDDEGNKLAGRNAKTGPNLYGVVGRQAGVVEGFRYGKDMVAAGEEAGLIWNEETFVAYVQAPTDYLREVLESRRARGKMAFQVRKEEDALNLYAYLADIGPEVEMEEEAASN